MGTIQNVAAPGVPMERLTLVLFNATNQASLWDELLLTPRPIGRLAGRQICNIHFTFRRNVSCHGHNLIYAQ
jgi:hypothetical protein